LRGSKWLRIVRSFITAGKHKLLKKDAVAGTEVKIYRDYSPISKSVAASEAMK
jgi:hypothetical protein